MYDDVEKEYEREFMREFISISFLKGPTVITFMDLQLRGRKAIKEVKRDVFT